jgi:hypothetical protein
VDLFESDEPHGFTRPRREASMRWMRRWLLKIDDAPVEADFPVATDAQLQCTETGQVLGALKGRSVFDLNAEREAELARDRAAFRTAHGKEELLTEVRRLIGLRERVRPARRHDRGEVGGAGYAVRKLVFEAEPGVLLPALLYTPDHIAAGRPLLVHVGAEPDKAAVIREREFAERVKAGHRLLVVDLRGMGETSPPEARPGPIGADTKEAFLSLHLDRPLLGQRVGDLLAVIAAMLDEARGGPASRRNRPSASRAA